MDYKYDQKLYDLFGVDPLNSYDEVAYLSKYLIFSLESDVEYKSIM